MWTIQGVSLHFATQEHVHIDKHVSDLLNWRSTNLWKFYVIAFYNWHDKINYEATHHDGNIAYDYGSYESSRYIH